MKTIAEGRVAQEDEHIMDGELAHMFRDRVVTTRGVKEALVIDPSGSSWLREMARAEFTEGTLSLVGANKAIQGVRNMYEALTNAA